MALFSERNGYTQIQDNLKEECIDKELRTSLWNVIISFPFEYINQDIYFISYPSEIKELIRVLHRDYFKRNLDELGSTSYPYIDIRQYFFKCEWYDVYNFLDMLVIK